MFQYRMISSLEKVFGDEPLKSPEFCSGSMLQNEIFAYQIAVKNSENTQVEITVESDLAAAIQVREVVNAPCEIPAMDKVNPDDVLRTTPGLYPDILRPLKGKWKLVANQWRAIWISVDLRKIQTSAKLHQIKVIFSNAEGELGSAAFNLNVIAQHLPEQKLIHTEWFHADCLYTYYKVPCWSQEHWALLGKYFASAAAHGINMLLTPLWTPPLDTEVGSERPTVQLLKITKQNGKYEFDFSRLERWIKLAQQAGIKYFEMSHFFSQWGAAATPKIVVEVDGKEEKMFGWQVKSTSEEYRDFLQQLIEPLVMFLDKMQLQGKCYFHISDEPNEEHLETYRYGSELISGLLNGRYGMIDALSDVVFYQNNLVKLPVAACDLIEPFMEANVSPLWTYYCVAQTDEVMNRFFNYHSSRNRILGILLYVYKLQGFLQWGFNFWYSQFSINQNINVFQTTDCDRGFPSGDAFLVYPGEDGPWDSLRYEVLNEALQDLRALELLEERIGRDQVMALLDEAASYRMTMKHYPKDPAFILNLRHNINNMLAK